MRKNGVSLLVGALCALFLIGQPTAVRAQGEAAGAAQVMSIALPAKVGDTVWYHSTMKLAFGGSDIVVERNRKNIVKEVKDNKDVVVESWDEGGTATVGGSPTDLPGSGLTTVTLNKANVILSYKPDEENQYLSNASLHVMALIDRIILPDHPVKPGDSWTTEVDNPLVKGKKVTIKATLVGEEKADGQPAWRVKQTIEADTELAGSRMKAETTALLDAATGELIEAGQTVKGLSSTNGSLDYTNTLKRIKPDGDKPGPDKAVEKKPAAP